ncbi:MAG TPA: hypothetical protein PL098_00110 [Brevundimonas diminuta]|nr:hypothetical protein [Brevundimonas diminuta]HRL23307.1 hypothetical protein [Brevundimonas diminuta]
MSKRQEAKRAELAAAAEAKGYMTVADLGAYLKTFPQNAPVTGYNGHEETGLVLPRSISLEYDKHTRMVVRYGTPEVAGPFLDIMGTL